MPWRRAWQPTPVFLPGESPWTEEPSWLQSMGSESDPTVQALVFMWISSLWINSAILNHYLRKKKGGGGGKDGVKRQSTGEMVFQTVTNQRNQIERPEPARIMHSETWTLLRHAEVSDSVRLSLLHMFVYYEFAISWVLFTN